MLAMATASAEKTARNIIDRTSAEPRRPRTAETLDRCIVCPPVALQNVLLRRLNL
jgi:hypothetical protein